MVEYGGKYPQVPSPGIFQINKASLQIHLKGLIKERDWLLF